MSGYYTYVLKSETSGLLYKGHTDNLERRLRQHNDPESHTDKFAPKHAPWILVYAERFDTRSEAVKREKFLKSGKGREWLKILLKAT